VAKRLLEVENLTHDFHLATGWLAGSGRVVRAVDGVSFHLEEGESLGLVGESGSGKSTVGRAILRLIQPTGGDIRFEGRSIANLTEGELRRLRRQMQMIFQDPQSSLNPRRTILRSVAEPLIVHENLSGRDLRERVRGLLETVGLQRQHMYRFPHELSGGQRQRVGLARALALRPKLHVLDEPASALDVSVQAQILNLLEKLQEDFGLTYLFISHNLLVIRHICDRVAVMYLGRIVETGPVETIFESPRHPYTEALLSAVPALETESGREEIILEGDVPNPLRIPSGCRFHPRCPQRIGQVCVQQDPAMLHVGEGHRVACHLYAEAPVGVPRSWCSSSKHGMNTSNPREPFESERGREIALS
jgi:oligopeptide/dipeptide ABC transporter ATP-binding protein